MSERFQEPGWFTKSVFNPIVAWLSRHGFSLAGSRVLEVQELLRIAPARPVFRID